MAKKKKVKRKKVKRTIPLTEAQKKRQLLDKIELIRQDCPHIEPTGEVIDEDTGEVLYRYTEAQFVFATYWPLLEHYRLGFAPVVKPGYQPQIVSLGGGAVAILTFYELTDKDTGYSIIGPAFGEGANVHWSANTAQTRAQKQFLLSVFHATWVDPEGLKDIEKRKAKKKAKEEARRIFEAQQRGELTTQQAFDKLFADTLKEYENGQRNSKSGNEADSQASEPTSPKGRKPARKKSKRSKRS